MQFFLVSINMEQSKDNINATYRNRFINCRAKFISIKKILALNLKKYLGEIVTFDFIYHAKKMKSKDVEIDRKENIIDDVLNKYLFKQSQSLTSINVQLCNEMSNIIRLSKAIPVWDGRCKESH